VSTILSSGTEQNFVITRIEDRQGDAPSSGAGSQGVLRHMPSRDNVGYTRFPLNNASDCQFGRLIVPILDFRIVFGLPMDEDSDANEHIVCSAAGMIPALTDFTTAFATPRWAGNK
jgi:hypothetical protein